MILLSRTRAAGWVVLLTALVVTLAFSPAQAQLSTTAVVDVETLNMRAAPDTRAATVAQLPGGTQITLTGRNAQVSWAYGTAETGAQGWVVLNFVRITGTVDVKLLPVVEASAPTGGGEQPAPPAELDVGPTVAPPPPPAVRGTLSGGFELGGQVQSLNAGTIAAMRRAGMTWVKRQAYAGDGGAVGLIAEAHAHGFKILISVIGDKNAVVTEGYQNDYAAYVASLAAAGADAIEVWNEMNLDREWKQGAISPALYVNLLAKAYNAIKAANPNTLVITGAPAPTGAEGAYGLDRVWNDDRYVLGMARAGAGRYADCIGIHYNEGIVSPTWRSGDPRDNYPTRYFDTMLNRGLAGFGGKKACFTELGYLTGEGYGPLPGGFAWASGTTLTQQARWLAEAALRASRSGRVRLMIVFNVDFTHYGEDPQAGYAMLRPGGACPACDSLAAIRR